MEHITLLATGLRFPEGPAFDGAGGLWCAEQEGEGVFCRRPNGQIERLKTGGKPNGLTLGPDGYIWFCDSGQNAIRRFHPDERHIQTVIDTFNGKPLNRPNDLLVDPAGNLIFSCPGPPVGEPNSGQPQGIVLSMTPGGMIQVVADGMHYANGLAFISGTDVLLIAETQKQRIWSGFWDAANMSWDTINVWATIDNITELAYGPDGMAFGPDGNLYAAVFGLGEIRVFDPDGRLLRCIALPGCKPTNCAFDPSGKLGLVITEAERGELLQIRL